MHDRDKQQSEARFHKLFDDTQAMSIQGYRADGTVVYWNAASERIYGYSTTEALGQSLYDLIIPAEMRSDFVQRVKDVLRQTGANANNLRFELTESLMANDIHFIIRQMRELRELGVSISLDDFGTGYASLAYLTQLPIDELKIDRAFVSDLNRQGKGELLAETLISLGRSMNLAVIAEGVETFEQFERLQELGCEFFQGYFFGKPSLDCKPYLTE
jgi:PAS domain S-box-containing protein